MINTILAALQASITHRKAVLKRLKMELTDPRYDNARKVLMTLSLIDHNLAEADAEMEMIEEDDAPEDFVDSYEDRKGMLE